MTPPIAISAMERSARPSGVESLTGKIFTADVEIIDPTPHRLRNATLDSETSIASALALHCCWRVELHRRPVYLTFHRDMIVGAQRRQLMESFERREAGFERKFAHDEELKFKATARRNRLLGHWAAEKLGLSGADADAYARDVVKANFEAPGDEDLVRKLRTDFDAKNIALSDHQIHRTMEELLAKAVEQIQAEKS
jgi:hypothetical protein